MSKDNQKVTGDSIYRVKMYKDGKRWVCAGATTLALAAGLVFANVNASADTTTTSDATTTEQVADTTTTNSSAASSDASSASTTSAASAAAKTAAVATSAAASTASSTTSTASSTVTTTSSAAQQSATTPASSSAATETAVKAAKVAATSAAVATSVAQSSATVTAPTSDNVTVTSDASVATTPASSATSATSTVSTGKGSLAASKVTNAANINVQGTSFDAEPGATYNTSITLTKDTSIDWTGANGQLVVKPVGSSLTSNGTWTATSYSINGGTPVTISSGNTVTISADDLINADTVTINYTYVANADNANATQTDMLNVTDIPDASATLNSAYDLTTGWTYSTTVTTDDSTTAEDAGDVNVTYEVVTGTDSNGDPITKTITGKVSQSGQVGTDYTVTPAVIDGYTYVGSSVDLTGTVAADGTNIVLYYVENTGLVVNYETSDGTSLADQNVISQGADGTFTRANGTYTITNPTIDGYTYVGYKIGNGAVQSGTPSAQVLLAGENDLTFVYEPVETPVEQSTVTVNYVDENGKVIKTATTQTLDNGSAYTIDKAAIDGYTYKSADGALSGTVSGDVTVTLTYSKDATTPVENQANLTINYVDENGKTIKTSSVTSQKVGDAYTVATPEIAGYKYDHSTGDAIAGTIGYNGNTITLVYKSNGTVTPTDQTKTITVKYVDANGKVIKTATTTEYKVGDTYTVATPSINGYTYKSADGALTGTVTDDATITLTYATTGTTTTAPTTAPGTGDNGNNGNNGGGTTTTAPVTTPSTGDNGNTGSTTTAATTAPATTTTATGDQVTTTAMTNNGTNGVVPATAATSLSPVVTTKTTTDAKTLPQTGEDENGTALAVLGLSTLLMGSALYFGVSRRKHEA